MEDISKHGKGPLNDELKRAVIEIKIGSTFEDALLGMSERLKSKTLDRTFRMIIEGRRVGGSLADVIETVAEDLRAILALQRERKVSVRDVSDGLTDNSNSRPSFPPRRIAADSG